MRHRPVGSLIALLFLPLGCGSLLGYESSYELDDRAGAGGTAPGASGATGEAVGGRAGSGGVLPAEGGRGGSAGAGASQGGGGNAGASGTAATGGAGGTATGTAGSGGTTASNGGNAGTGGVAAAGAGGNAGSAGIAGAAGGSGASGGTGGAAGAGNACGVATAPPATCTGDLTTNAAQCGACDLSCGMSSTCVGGTCTLDAASKQGPLALLLGDGTRVVGFEPASGHAIVTIRPSGGGAIVEELGLSGDLPVPRIIGPLKLAGGATGEETVQGWSGAAFAPNDALLLIARVPGAKTPGPLKRVLVRVARGNGGSPPAVLGRVDLAGDTYQAGTLGFPGAGTENFMRDAPVVVGDFAFVWESTASGAGTLRAYATGTLTPAALAASPRARWSRPVAYGGKLYYASQGIVGAAWILASLETDGSATQEQPLSMQPFGFVTDLALGGGSLFVTETDRDPQDAGNSVPVGSVGALYRRDLRPGCKPDVVKIADVDLPLTVAADETHVYVVSIAADDPSRKTFVLTRRFHDGTGVTVLRRESRTDGFPGTNEHRWRLAWPPVPAVAFGKSLLLVASGNDGDSSATNPNQRKYLFGLPR